MPKEDLFRNCRVYDYMSRRVQCRVDASLLGQGMATEVSMYLCCEKAEGRNAHFTTFEDFKQFSKDLQAFIVEIEEKTRGRI